MLFIAIAWGTSLPIDHTASCTLVSHRSPAQVRAIIADEPGSAKWRSDLSGVTARGGGMWVESSKSGFQTTYLIVLRHDGSITHTIVAQPDAAFAGSWTYSFAPQPGGRTSLTVVENGQIYNPVFRLLSRYMIGYTATMRRYLTDLSAALNEPAQVTCATGG